MKWEVPVVYIGQMNYVIEDDPNVKTHEQAVAKAKDLYEQGVKPTELANEWEKIHHVGTVIKHLSGGEKHYPMDDKESVQSRLYDVIAQLTELQGLQGKNPNYHNAILQAINETRAAALSVK